MSKDKEAITKHEAPGPLVVPDFLKGEHGGEGFDQMGKADVVLPRLALCQAMSPQRKRTNPNYIDGLADGDLFNSVSGEIYGEKVEIIPLQFAKSRIYFKDLSEGGGILCQSLNGVDGGRISETCEGCPNSKFSQDDLPACTLFYNYPALVVGSHEPVVLSLKSSALKAARQWNSRMKLLGDKPMFAGIYEVKVIATKNDKGDFFTPTISFKRYVTEAEFQLAKNLYEGMKGKHVAADDTGLGEEQTAADAKVPF